MKTIIAKHNQSLMDIAIEHYGSVEGVFWLVEDNPDTIKGIVDNAETEQLFIRDSIINKQVIEKAKPRGVATLDEQSKGSGIGFWKIGDSFIVAENE